MARLVKYGVPLAAGLWTFCETGDASAAGKDMLLDVSGMDLPVMFGRGIASAVDGFEAQIQESVRRSTKFNDAKGYRQDRVGRTRLHGVDPAGL